MKLKIDDPIALPAIVITAALGAWLGTRLLDGVVPTGGFQVPVFLFLATAFLRGLLCAFIGRIPDSAAT